MKVDPDAQLAAAGDVEAFEQIYLRHHHRVYLLCLRMVRNVSQAEDLTQEVFIQSKMLRTAAILLPGVLVNIKKGNPSPGKNVMPRHFCFISIGLEI